MLNRALILERRRAVRRAFVAGLFSGMAAVAATVAVAWWAAL